MSAVWNEIYILYIYINEDFYFCNLFTCPHFFKTLNVCVRERFHSFFFFPPFFFFLFFVSDEAKMCDGGPSDVILWGA